jgi:hypothetical protein
MQQRRHEGQMGMAHVARFLGRMGPTRSPLVAPMSSIFVPMDSSWPKTDYIKGPPTGHKGERHQNTKTRNRSLGDEDRRGKTPARCCRCDLHPLQWLYLCHHDEEGVVHLWTMGLWQLLLYLSLSFFIVLAPYELHNMIMAIFVLPLWWIFLWFEIWDCNCSLF